MQAFITVRIVDGRNRDVDRKSIVQAVFLRNGFREIYRNIRLDDLSTRTKKINIAKDKWRYNLCLTIASVNSDWDKMKHEKYN